MSFSLISMLLYSDYWSTAILQKKNKYFLSWWSWTPEWSRFLDMRFRLRHHGYIHIAAISTLYIHLYSYNQTDYCSDFDAVKLDWKPHDVNSTRKIAVVCLLLVFMKYKWKWAKTKLFDRMRTRNRFNCCARYNS